MGPGRETLQTVILKLANIEQAGATINKIQKYYGMLVDELPDARLYPVTLPIEEALESLTINLASFIKPQRNLFPKLKDITITPKSFLLVYIPFIEKHHEFIQPKLHLTINKKRLAFASNL